MKKAKTVAGKAVKVLGVTCIALGGAALIASGAAVKALNEGAVYLAKAVKNIVDEPKKEVVCEEVAVEENTEEVQEEQVMHLDIPVVVEEDIEEV